MLKLLAGSMINIMLGHGVMPELIWSDKTDLALYSRFPRAQQQDTQWITSFEDFVEELSHNLVPSQEYTHQVSMKSTRKPDILLGNQVSSLHMRFLSGIIAIVQRKNLLFSSLSLKD